MQAAHRIVVVNESTFDSQGTPYIAKIRTKRMTVFGRSRLHLGEDLLFADLQGHKTTMVKEPSRNVDPTVWCTFAPLSHWDVSACVKGAW